MYQGGLMMSTIIGPGTIFLMIVGALQTAFGSFGLDMWGSFIANIIPLLLFIFACYLCSSKTQVSLRTHKLTFCCIRYILMPNLKYQLHTVTCHLLMCLSYCIVFVRQNLHFKYRYLHSI